MPSLEKTFISNHKERGIVNASPMMAKLVRLLILLFFAIALFNCCLAESDSIEAAAVFGKVPYSVFGTVSALLLDHSGNIFVPSVFGLLWCDGTNSLASIWDLFCDSADSGDVVGFVRCATRVFHSTLYPNEWYLGVMLQLDKARIASKKTKQFFMREKFDKIIKMAIRKIANLSALFYGISQKKRVRIFRSRPAIQWNPRHSCGFFWWFEGLANQTINWVVLLPDWRLIVEMLIICKVKSYYFVKWNADNL